jgi:hypothetical protein
MGANYNPPSGKAVKSESHTSNYQVVAADADSKFFNDFGASANVQFTLPQIEGFVDSGGGIFRFQATRTATSGSNPANMLAIYGDARFKIGVRENLYSLYSSNAGDYLELTAENDNGTLVWRVIGFSGYWEDRD